MPQCHRATRLGPQGQDHRNTVTRPVPRPSHSTKVLLHENKVDEVCLQEARREEGRGWGATVATCHQAMASTAEAPFQNTCHQAMASTAEASFRERCSDVTLRDKPTSATAAEKSQGPQRDRRKCPPSTSALRRISKGGAGR